MRPSLHNLSPLQELKISRQPTPLWVLLYLYSKAEHDCYIDYMAGARDLLYYLTANGTVPLDLQEELYPEINDPEFKVPGLLLSYPSDRLSGMISDISNPRVGSNMRVWVMDTAKMSRAIQVTMIKKVLPLL